MNYGNINPNNIKDYLKKIDYLKNLIDNSSSLNEEKILVDELNFLLENIQNFYIKNGNLKLARKYEARFCI